MLPFNSDVRPSSVSERALSGSSKKSPRTMANENAAFACNFEIFSKTSINLPETAPMTSLQV